MVVRTIEVNVGLAVPWGAFRRGIIWPKHAMPTRDLRQRGENLSLEIKFRRFRCEPCEGQVQCRRKGASRLFLYLNF